MAIKVDGRIVKFGVAGEAAETKAEARAQAKAQAPDAPQGAAGQAQEARPTADVIQMHEQLERPEQLAGSTYKIKTPLSEVHALYVTINDIVLNPGTEHELRRPFEIFINSKNMEHFQWIVALTRIISAVFRKGGRRRVPGRGAPLGVRPGGRLPQARGPARPVPGGRDRHREFEDHLIKIGLMTRERPDAGQQRHIDEIRRELGCEDGEFPPDAVLCARLQHQGGGHDGRLHDLPQLRRLQVRLIGKAVPRGARQAAAHARGSIRRPYTEQRAPEGTPALGPPSPGARWCSRETAGLFSPAP